MLSCYSHKHRYSIMVKYCEPLRSPQVGSTQGFSFTMHFSTALCIHAICHKATILWDPHYCCEDGRKLVFFRPNADGTFLPKWTTFWDLPHLTISDSLAIWTYLEVF